MMRFALFFLFAVALSAQTATAPVAATVLDSRGELVSITGVLQSLLPGVPLPISGKALSASFGANGGIVKTDSQIVTLDAAGQVQSTMNALPGPALFGSNSDGTVGWILYDNAAEIQNLDGSVRFSARSLGDAVVALGQVSGTAMPVLARTGSQLWGETVDTASGAILTQMPIDGSAPGIYFEGGWLVKGGSGLLWLSHEFAMPADVTTLQAAGPHAVAINGAWLLNGAMKILEIPGAARRHPRIGASPPIGVTK